MKLNGNNLNSPAGQSRESAGLLAQLARVFQFGSRVTRRRGQAGFSLEEVIMSMGITALIVAGAARAHVAAAMRAEWSACSFAASNSAMQRVEQIRSARWDTLATPVLDQLVSSNFPPQIVTLEVPSIGTNVVYATNFTSVSVLSLDPPMRVVRTDCVWRFSDRGLFTNSTVVYRGPDQ